MSSHFAHVQWHHRYRRRLPEPHASRREPAAAEAEGERPCRRCARARALCGAERRGPPPARPDAARRSRAL